MTKFTVNHVILKKDITPLAVAEFADAGQNLNLKWQGTIRKSQ
ncbi:hypothetical protein [Nostoc sp. UHCC 0302]